MKRNCPMSAQNPSPFRPQAAVSVTRMAKLISMSRSRFYAYIRQGVFPEPIYSLTTRRPFYTAEMQEEIVTTRRTGLTPEGRYVLFYEASPKSGTSTPPERSLERTRNAELVQGLKGLGLNVTAAQVSEALAVTFPSGTDNVDEAVVLRTVYRHLRRTGVG
jgi:predicted DNA-binding transcriptional regulator AlpA